MNTDGLERLGRLFTLPAMPYDMASTEYFLQVIRTIAEVAPSQTLQKLAQHVKTSLEETKGLWQDLGPKPKLVDWVAISSQYLECPCWRRSLIVLVQRTPRLQTLT